MSSWNHWRTALPAYLRISLSFFVQIAGPALVILLLVTLWTGFTTDHWAISHEGLAIALIFGGLFSVLALVTAVGSDIYRNRRAAEPTVAWQPQLMWRIFLYLGAIFFLAAAFLSYHQGAWLSVLFIAFAAFSAIVARKYF